MLGIAHYAFGKGNDPNRSYGAGGRLRWAFLPITRENEVVKEKSIKAVDYLHRK